MSPVLLWPQSILAGNTASWEGKVIAMNGQCVWNFIRDLVVGSIWIASGPPDVNCSMYNLHVMHSSSSIISSAKNLQGCTRALQLCFCS